MIVLFWLPKKMHNPLLVSRILLFHKGRKQLSNISKLSGSIGGDTNFCQLLNIPPKKNFGKALAFGIN